MGSPQSARVVPRSSDERQQAANDRLECGGNLWLATASPRSGPHLIPVSFWWDGSRLTTATFEGSRTHRNVEVQPHVRASIGPTTDVVMIDATAVVRASEDVDPVAIAGHERVSGVPEASPGFVYLQLMPYRMQVWNGRAEFEGRTVMRGGRWVGR